MTDVRRASARGLRFALVLLATRLDLVFQWVILGAAHPVAALVVDPTLIAFPDTLARSRAGRSSRRG